MILKKYISIVFILLTYAVEAQIAKGKSSIGLNLFGDFSTGSHKNYTFKNFTFNSELLFEHYLKNNLSVGIGLGYDFKRNNIKNEIEYLKFSANTNTKVFSQFISVKKLWFVNQKLAFHSIVNVVSSNYKYEFVDLKNPQNNVDIPDNWGFTFKLQLGATYLINPKFAINIQSNFLEYYFAPNNFSYSGKPIEQYLNIFGSDGRLRFGVFYILDLNKKSSSN